MPKVRISIRTQERIRKHSMYDGIGFSEPDDTGHVTIEISEDVLGRLEAKVDYDLEEDDQIDCAINDLLDTHDHPTQH